MRKLNCLFDTDAKKIFWIVWAAYSYYFAARGGAIVASVAALTQSIVNSHTIAIDEFIIDTTDAAFFNGHYYSGFAPGLSLLLVPGYALLKALAVPLLQAMSINPKMVDKLPVISALLGPFSVALVTSVGVAAFYKLTGFFSEDRHGRLIATFGLAFGTIFFFYGSLLWPRVVASSIGLIAFYMIIRAQNTGGKHNYLAIGLVAGSGLLFEYTYGILLVLFLLYILATRGYKKAGLFLLGAAIVSSLLLSYHYAAFDSPFSPPYAWRVSPRSQEVLSVGFFGLGQPDAWKLTENLVLPYNGLFFYCPILIIGLLSLLMAIKRNLFRKEMLFCLAWFAAICTYSASYMLLSGCSFGPRLFLPVIPFLALPLAFSKKFFKEKIVHCFLAISVFINLIGAMNPNVCTHMYGYARLGWFAERFLQFGPLNTRFQFLVGTGFMQTAVVVELVLLHALIGFALLVLGGTSRAKLLQLLQRNRKLLEALLVASVVFFGLAAILPGKEFGYSWLIAWSVLTAELAAANVWVRLQGR